jgi:hypothetical protein
LSELHNCPELVNETIEKVKDMKPDYTYNGEYINMYNISKKYGLEMSDIPKTQIEVSHNSKTSQVHESSVRQVARKKYHTKQEWLLYLIGRELTKGGVEHTPLIDAIIRHMSNVVTEDDAYLWHQMNKFRKLSKQYPHADIQYAKWIYENYILKDDSPIDTVELHVAKSNDDKHQIIEKLSYMTLPSFGTYEGDMAKRAKTVWNLGVKSKELAWHYIATGLDKDSLLDDKTKEYKTDMQKIGISEEDIDYALEEYRHDSEIAVIHLFALYNAKISYYVDDE